MDFVLGFTHIKVVSWRVSATGMNSYFYVRGQIAVLRNRVDKTPVTLEIYFVFIPHPIHITMK